MIKSLYISYNGITEPIVRSQVIPYLWKLSKGGIKFYFITFEKKRLTKEEIQNINLSLKEQFKDGPVIEWTPLKYHKAPSIPATLWDIFSGCAVSFFIALKNKIDIIHARAIVAALMGWPVARLLSKKFIFDTRGIDSEEYVDAGSWKRGGLTHRVVSSLEVFLTRHADHVIVLTERFLDILRQKYKRYKINFSVIPCAVDIDKFTPEKKLESPLKRLGIQDKHIIVYTGSLGTWYMLDEMADFFKILKEHISVAHFLILTNSDTNAVFGALKHRGLNKEDITVNSVSYEDIAGYLPGCAAGIFFIKPVFSKISSSPVKFAEYLASGLPVIINYGIGDTEEIVRKERVGVIVEGFNKSCYNKAFNELMDLLKDGDLARRCAAAAKKYLSLDSASSEYEKIYKNLIKQ